MDQKEGGGSEGGSEKIDVSLRIGLSHAQNARLGALKKEDIISL